MPSAAGEMKAVKFMVKLKLNANQIKIIFGLKI